ncbi:hypothetical protein [Herbidospora mongoliensis]|uniref:hypothetical protein n=1 Tax=Herbidospora mongoliensis TaxID=688067 RepID=UPI00082FCFE1|nr:hypothetical protein [Herbidospora mongoliensis]
MNEAQDQLRIYQQAALTGLRRELTVRGLNTVYLVDQKSRPTVEVEDCNMRMRRIYVHTGFWWFYWGDQPDERVSCLELPNAVAVIMRAARAGFREGVQGDLVVNLQNIADAYRT